MRFLLDRMKHLTHEERGAWLIVFLAFLFGDVGYTYVGLQRGFTEAHPVANVILEYGLPAMFVAKAGVLIVAGAFFLVGYRVVPGAQRNHRIVIPVTLGVWGIFIFLWNAEAVLGILSTSRKPVV